MIKDASITSEARIIAVVTTIQSPTSSVDCFLQRFAAEQIKLVVVGDAKGPDEYNRAGVLFYNLERQMALPFPLASRLPKGHYTRKNLGYLVAMQQGANCIYETDDDNKPLDEWYPRGEYVPALTVSLPGWVNIYSAFGVQNIWPRGFALEKLAECNGEGIPLGVSQHSVTAPIQQALANGSPDVDAIWRLTQDRNIMFTQGPSIAIGRGSWCPFNSQSTWWWKSAFPLLYLPSHCSFRMTDIWRSFIAQRCLWELGLPVVFHAPEVYQERNPHKLLRDFKDEVLGYLRNGELVDRLSELGLASGKDHVCQNLRKCYEELVKHEFIPSEELALLGSWLVSLDIVLGKN
jgi:hypothetical protein